MLFYLKNTLFSNKRSVVANNLSKINKCKITPGKNIDDNIKHTKATFYTKTSQPLKLARSIIIKKNIFFKLINFYHLKYNFYQKTVTICICSVEE